MKSTLGTLAIAAYILVLDRWMMVLERTHPAHYATWLAVTAVGLPLWAWAVRKWRRGDFG